MLKVTHTFSSSGQVRVLRASQFGSGRIFDVDSGDDDGDDEDEFVPAAAEPQRNTSLHLPVYY